MEDEESGQLEGRETGDWAVLPGQQVRAKIIGQQQPWGVFAKIIGYERAAASIDLLAQFGGKPNREVEAMFPAPGTEIDAVVTEVRRWDGTARIRLSIRPEDLASYTGWCDFCWEPVVLSPGGGALVLEVRSNDGPGSHQIVSHRECLVDRLHPENDGARARISRQEYAAMSRNAAISDLDAFRTDQDAVADHEESDPYER